jgi:hypothetical protein
VQETRDERNFSNVVVNSVPFEYAFLMSGSAFQFYPNLGTAFVLPSSVKSFFENLGRTGVVNQFLAL